MEKAYIAIDLKSFYASVECVELGLNPLTTNLVVADKTRTEKTICLAVSPALKAYGISGRARLYEVIQKVNEINRARAKNGKFVGRSVDDLELKRDQNLELDYIVAPPRMAYYVRYSARIYNIYLNYVAEEDIHVYSIDEVFIDATSYLTMYKMSAGELARKIMQDVLKETGITATAGVGTNLYLAKVAMDILAKHAKPDKYGCRIAELDEMSYRRLLWEHKPITDFWRVGRGYAKRLSQAGILTMGDVALCSEKNEDYLYKMFGVNAELLIDHAWGYEPCEMVDIKKYRPSNNSFSSGQVLKEPYDYRKARVVVQEMADEIALKLLSKGLVTDQITLTINYDKVNLEKKDYYGAVTQDYYGREVPKYAHGTKRLSKYSASSSLIRNAVLEIFDKQVDSELLIRRITINVMNVVFADSKETNKLRQLELFEDVAKSEKLEGELKKEERANEAIIAIKRKYGKNAILKGINFEEGATGRERNRQIGGHHR